MNTHLSDEAIQAYLDEGQDRAALLTHVEFCSDCRQRLEAFRTLYADLAQPPADAVLPPDFARRAAAAILHAAEPEAPFWINETMLLAGLGLVSLGVSAVFIDWATLGTVAQRWLDGLGAASALSGWLRRFSGGLSLLPVACVAAGVIAWLDHVLQHRQPNPGRPKAVRS